MKLDLSALAIPAVLVAQNQQRELFCQAASLSPQELQQSTPVVPVVPVQNGNRCRHTETSEREHSVPPNPISDALAGLVLRVASLEGWPQQLQAEHLAIIRKQLISGECDADTICTGWLAHIDRWHHDCKADFLIHLPIDFV